MAGGPGRGEPVACTLPTVPGMLTARAACSPLSAPASPPPGVAALLTFYKKHFWDAALDAPLSCAHSNLSEKLVGQAIVRARERGCVAYVRVCGRGTSMRQWWWWLRVTDVELRPSEQRDTLQHRGHALLSGTFSMPTQQCYSDPNTVSHARDEDGTTPIDVLLFLSTALEQFPSDLDPHETSDMLAALCTAVGNIRHDLVSRRPGGGGALSPAELHGWTGADRESRASWLADLSGTPRALTPAASSRFAL
jgi:hypothetical protein